MTPSGAARAVEVVDSIAGTRRLCARLRDAGSLALVPTMGALHEGHLRLVEHARAQADAVLVSIFVNPLQFGPGEDLERYPRTFERDLELIEPYGVAAVFAPRPAAMYPLGDPAVSVAPTRGADRLCGRSRPGHFAGVLTVVAKLFNVVAPTVAVFGRKDFQQTVLIRWMVRDLDLDVRIDTVPTVRDADGLALSSRNAYLSAEARERARSLPQTLRAIQERFAAGERDAARLEEMGRERLAGVGLEVDYLEIVDPDTLHAVEPPATADAVCAAAVHVGETRLIDNVRLGDPTIGA